MTCEVPCGSRKIKFMGNFEIDAWGQTDKGLKRENNQDSFTLEEDLGLFVLADGMGGHSGGEVASKLAVDTVVEVVREGISDANTPVELRDLLKTAFREASHRIFDKSIAEPVELKGMGTTLVVAMQKNDILLVANVGDSRAYLICSPYMWQITEDHSLVNEQIRAGLLREEDADRSGGKSVITRSVGFEREAECDIVERKLEFGDQVLLCSDGLSGLVPDEDIAKICKKTPPDQVVGRCIEEAKKRGGDDNVTVLFLMVRNGT